MDALIAFAVAPLAPSSFRPPSRLKLQRCPLPTTARPTPLRRVASPTAQLESPSPQSEDDPDVIIIGSGFGGLCAAAALTAYGKKPLVLESHYAPGGVAHGFSTRTPIGDFHFDTGPSFFCSLSDSASLNPLKHALDLVQASVPTVSYDSFVIDDIVAKTSVHVYDDHAKTLDSIRQNFGQSAASQLRRFYELMLRIAAGMRVPSVALRGDWRLSAVLARPRWAVALLSLLPFVPVVSRPISQLISKCGVTNPQLLRMLDVETFLLSGLKADATIAAEIAFMVSERGRPGAMQYPVGGARAIVDALVSGITANGGKVRLKAHVEEILVRDGICRGVRLRNGEELYASHVFSNASLWDTVHHLLPEHTKAAASLPKSYRRTAMQTPLVESFMHVHMAIPSHGLSEASGFVGHHAVTLDSRRDIAEPGNTVMVSVPTMWSPDLAPDGWHIVHAYTLERYENWETYRKNREGYEDAKKRAATPLFAAFRHVIADLDTRLEEEGSFVKIGSPLTHERFNRRYRGTYGAAVRAGEAEFEWPEDIPIRNLKRCSDSTFPGIGVPSSAAAGLIAANELASVGEHLAIVDRVFPRKLDDELQMISL